MAAAAAHGDISCCRWVLPCRAAQRRGSTLIPLRCRPHAFVCAAFLMYRARVAPRTTASQALLVVVSSQSHGSAEGRAESGEGTAGGTADDTSIAAAGGVGMEIDSGVYTFVRPFGYTATRPQTERRCLLRCCAWAVPFAILVRQDFARLWRGGS